MHPARPLVQCVALALLAASCCIANAQPAEKCFHRSDVVIAIDTASSLNADEFEKLKPIVKKIVARFKVSQAKTRMGLISYDWTAKMHLNFEDTLDADDVNRAVDRIKYTGGYSRMFPAMQLAYKYMFNNLRKVHCWGQLIMVMDARYEDVNDRFMEQEMEEYAVAKVEAFKIKRSYIGFHLVAVGSPWHRGYLNAAQGDNSNLNLNLDRAFETVQSLNLNHYCKACTDREDQSYTGPCLDGMRHSWTATFIDNPIALDREDCRMRISRKVEQCNAQENCNQVSRSVGSCGAENLALVTSSWKYFEERRLMCRTVSTFDYTFCNRTAKCTNKPQADLVILLDKTQSSRGFFNVMKEAAKTIVNFFDFGERHSGAHVAVMTFQSGAGLIQEVVRLGDIKTKQQIIEAIDGIPSSGRDFGPDRDQFHAINHAINHLANGRQNKNHKNNHIVMITTGQTNVHGSRIESVQQQIVDQYVTNYVIGVGNVDKYMVKDITAPESDSNSFIIRDSTTLVDTAKQLASLLCVQIDEPNPRLCERGTQLHQFSQCNAVSKTQTEYIITFGFNNYKQCVKNRQFITHNRCRKIIKDVYAGYETFKYTDSRYCHRFQINPQFPSDPMFVKQISISTCLSKQNTCFFPGETQACRDEFGVPTNDCKCTQKNGVAIADLEPY